MTAFNSGGLMFMKKQPNKNQTEQKKKKKFGKRLESFIKKHESTINVVVAIIFGVVEVVAGSLITCHYQKKALCA